jgi:hypothetical protein
MRATAGFAVAIALLTIGGCDRMVHQPRQSTYSMPPIAVPAGAMEFESVSDRSVPPLTLSLLQRGRDRYHIFCAPCHSELGDGRGMVVQRGFPAPPSFDSESVRSLSPQQLFDVISKGYGVMYSFDDRVPPTDRWAIVAYLHALERSQHDKAGSP